MSPMESRGPKYRRTIGIHLGGTIGSDKTTSPIEPLSPMKLQNLNSDIAHECDGTTGSNETIG